MRIRSCTVHIPHLLDYVVRFRVTTNLPDGCAARCDRGDFKSTIYVRPDVTVFEVAHEIVHALRNICVTIDAAFESESEHMAYLMQFLLTKAYGGKP